METIFAFVVGGIFAAAVALILQRSLFKLIMGLVLLSQASNLLVFICAGMTRFHPPLIGKNSNMALPAIADPLPQALILTAIVISFGVLSFVFVLLYRTSTELGADDVDQIREESVL